VILDIQGPKWILGIVVSACETMVVCGSGPKLAPPTHVVDDARRGAGGRHETGKLGTCVEGMVSLERWPTTMLWSRNCCAVTTRPDRDGSNPSSDARRGADGRCVWWWPLSDVSGGNAPATEVNWILDYPTARSKVIQ
jgi:hypothetical protein